jgi:hypothetical protein
MGHDYLSRISTELHLTISKFVAPKDLCALARVSHQFYKTFRQELYGDIVLSDTQAERGAALTRLIRTLARDPGLASKVSRLKMNVAQDRLVAYEYDVFPWVARVAVPCFHFHSPEPLKVMKCELDLGLILLAMLPNLKKLDLEIYWNDLRNVLGRFALSEEALHSIPGLANLEELIARQGTATRDWHLLTLPKLRSFAIDCPGYRSITQVRQGTPPDLTITSLVFETESNRFLGWTDESGDGDEGPGDLIVAHQCVSSEFNHMPHL